MKKLAFKVLFFSTILYTSCEMVNATNAERHIYNNTSYSWTFDFHPDHTWSSDRVYIYNNQTSPHKCINDSADPIKDGPCTIAPTPSAIDITYDADNADINEGNLYITDSCGTTKMFPYSPDTGPVNIDSSYDPSIQTDTPSGGDITIVGQCFKKE